MGGYAPFKLGAMKMADADFCSSGVCGCPVFRYLEGTSCLNSMYDDYVTVHINYLDMATTISARDKKG